MTSGAGEVKGHDPSALFTIQLGPFIFLFKIK
jgi:hypothetical protein